MGKCGRGLTKAHSLLLEERSDKGTQQLGSVEGVSLLLEERSDKGAAVGKCGRGFPPVGRKI